MRFIHVFLLDWTYNSIALLIMATFLSLIKKILLE